MGWSQRRLGIALAWVLALAGCGGETVVYDVPPDATAWGSRRTRWEVPDGGAALVTNSGASSITVLDLAAGRTIGTFPVGVVPLADNGPHHLGVDLARGVVFTPLSFPAPPIDPGPHAAHGSSVSSGVLVKRALDDFRLLGRADVDANPGDMVLSPDGSRVYVSHYDLRRAIEHPGNRAMQVSSLVVVDARTMQRVATVPLCIAAHGMVITPDGRTLYAACYGDDALAVVPLGGATVVPELVPLGRELAQGSPRLGPYALAVSPDGGTVYVSCTASAEASAVLAYDVAARRFDETRALRRPGGRPYFPTFTRDGRSMLLPLQNRDGLLRVVLGSPPRVERQVALRPEQCVLPHQVERGPDGRFYLVCEGRHGTTAREPGTVLALEPDTLAVVAQFPTGIYPDAIAFVGARR